MRKQRERKREQKEREEKQLYLLLQNREPFLHLVFLKPDSKKVGPATCGGIWQQRNNPNNGHSRWW